MTLVKQIEILIQEVENLIPEFLKNPDDARSQGNAAICILDENGNVYGKLFGADQIQHRRSFQIAWTKASQVKITGYKTEEYERKVFNQEISYKEFGIIPPDFIGWKGGQPVVLKDGSRLSVGFSGFTGQSDLDIVNRALEITGI